MADERSFRRAADRLGYVQSAISRQIAYLEQLTGERLIERSQGPKPVQLTEAGELLLNHANDILATIEAAKADIGDLQGGRTGDVRVGFFAGVPTRILAPALAAFGRRHPGVRVASRETVTDAPLIELVRKGSLDLALAHLPIEPGPFETCQLMSVPWVLMVPAGAQIARSPHAPTLSEIGRLPLIAPQSRKVDPWMVGPHAAELGEPRIVFRSDSPQTVQALVGAGVGAAVVPRLAVTESDPRITAIDLSEVLSPASIGAVWLRDNEPSGAVGQFLELLLQICSILERKHAPPPEPALAARH
ncbi:LysR family transcriptional regulator [Solirubrobacter sp. CPCC 204708]|nr:LysR family transcriptional regulator [Solirubrobacter deserti]